MKDKKIFFTIFVTYIEGVKRIIGVCCSFFCSANIKTKTYGMLQTIALPNNMCTKLIVCIRSSITKLNLKIENCFSFNKRIIYIRALLHWSCIFTHSHTFVLTYVHTTEKLFKEGAGLYNLS